MKAPKIAPKHTNPTDETLLNPALLSGAGASAGVIHIEDGSGATEGGDDGVFAGVGAGDSTGGEGARGSTGEGVGATKEAGAGARGWTGEGAGATEGAGVGARGSTGESGAGGCTGEGVGARGTTGEGARGSTGDGVGTSGIKGGCAGGKNGDTTRESDTTDLTKTETSMRTITLWYEAIFEFSRTAVV